MRTTRTLQAREEENKNRVLCEKIKSMPILLHTLSGSMYLWRQDKDEFKYFSESADEIKQLFGMLKSNFEKLGVKTSYPFLYCHESMKSIAVNTVHFTNLLNSHKLSEIIRIEINQNVSPKVTRISAKIDEEISKVKINLMSGILTAFSNAYCFWKYNGDWYQCSNDSLDKVKRDFQNLKNKLENIGIQLENQFMYCDESKKIAVVNVSELNKFMDDDTLIEIKKLMKLYTLLENINSFETDGFRDGFSDFSKRCSNYAIALQQIDSYVYNKSLMRLCLFNINNMIRDGRLTEEKINNAELPANLKNAIIKPT